MGTNERLRGGLFTALLIITKRAWENKEGSHFIQHRPSSLAKTLTTEYPILNFYSK